jgi:hypothetical protein
MLLVLALAMAACKGGRGDIATLRGALATGDASAVAGATRGAPRCDAEAGARAPDACLAEIAAWLGSKTGFHVDPPDQASAATAALVVTRDGRGEWVPAPDAWLASARTGSGAGVDSLRLAMATRIMVSVGPLVRSLSSDDDARALMRAVASSVPGACDTYATLGAGADVNAGPPERTADHSPCVQKDLERSTGPRERGRYGSGLWRGAEGALSLWKDAAKALREGSGRADASVQGALGVKLEAIDAALATIETKKLPPAPDYSMFMSDVHADAGVPLRGAPLPARGVPARPAGSGGLAPR